jgi:hypothetical protein
MKQSVDFVDKWLHSGGMRGINKILQILYLPYYVVAFFRFGKMDIKNIFV